MTSILAALPAHVPRILAILDDPTLDDDQALAALAALGYTGDETAEFLAIHRHGEVDLVEDVTSGPGWPD